MDFIKIGWFILIYIGVGWVLDILGLISTVIFFAYKEYKAQEKNEQSPVQEFDCETINNYEDHCQTLDKTRDWITFAYDSDIHGKELAKAIILGRLCWPVTLPMGLAYFIEYLKD